MILVHWQIRPAQEAAFLDYWRRSAAVRDRAGLIGEFLSRVVPGEAAPLPWITWHLPEEAGTDAAHYLNVGLWASEAAFLDQIAGMFDDDRPVAAFELRRRRRMLLAPQAWRVGGAALPDRDSAGVA